VRQLLNKKAFESFRQRCRSAGLTQVHLQRRESGQEVRYQYNAKDPRTRKLFTGEWVIPKVGGNDASEQEKAFRTLVESEFAVKTHGMGDEEPGEVVATAGPGAGDGSTGESAKAVGKSS